PGQGLGVRAADDDLRPGAPLQLGEPAGVIEVGMAHHQDLHVLELEAELVDVAHDLRGRLGEAAVDEHVALGGGDEERGDLRRADGVDVPHHVERFARLGPSARRPRRAEEEQREDHGVALAALVPAASCPRSWARKICQVRSVSSALLSWKSSLGSPGCCGSLGRDAEAGTAEATVSSALKWLGRLRSRGGSSSDTSTGPGCWRTYRSGVMPFSWM